MIKSSLASLQTKQRASSALIVQGTHALKQKLPISLICTWRQVTKSGYRLEIDQNI